MQLAAIEKTSSVCQCAREIDSPNHDSLQHALADLLPGDDAADLRANLFGDGRLADNQSGVAALQRHPLLQAWRGHE